MKESNKYPVFHIKSSLLTLDPKGVNNVVEVFELDSKRCFIVAYLLLMAFMNSNFLCTKNSADVPIEKDFNSLVLKEPHGDRDLKGVTHCHLTELPSVRHAGITILPLAGGQLLLGMVGSF